MKARLLRRVTCLLTELSLVLDWFILHSKLKNFSLLILLIRRENDVMIGHTSFVLSQLTYLTMLPGV